MKVADGVETTTGKNEAVGKPGKPRRKVNQQLLADMLDLSVSTVSRCFTNHSGINPRTRAQVFRLAESLGYQYLDNRTKPAADRERNLQVGVMVCAHQEKWEPDNYEEPGALLLSGVCEYAQLNNHVVDLQILEAAPEGASHEEIEHLEWAGWDGALLIYSFPSKVLKQIIARKPCVSLVQQYGNIRRETVQVDCVDVDHFEGISQIIDHLIELGHEEVGFVSRVWQPQAFWVVRRFGALMEKYLIMGREFNLSNYLIRQNPMEKTRQAFVESVQRRIEAGVTALICASDRDAFDLIRDLREAGIKVPEDVSVTGFDGLAQPEGLPKVATIRIPHWQIGRSAFERLERLVQRPSEPRAHTFLSGHFDPGETLAAPRR